MKKKLWVIIILLFICALVFGGKWLLDRDNLVEMMEVDEVLYIVTYEPANKEDALEKIGEIEHKIKSYQIPDENFTSNYLNEGTELYKAKNEEDFPRIILYKEEGEFYIASEAVRQPGQEQ
ncbi:hypothetical protein ACU57W_002632 [Listeria monocytogenes]